MGEVPTVDLLELYEESGAGNIEIGDFARDEIDRSQGDPMREQCISDLIRN